MNQDVYVAVHCYAGEQQQVEELLPFWKRHETPVLLLSPETAPVQVDDPTEQVTCLSAGRHGWSGEHTLDRQIAHWKILAATSPRRFVLYHDADSILLPAEIPSYVLTDAIWSNESDSMEFLRRVHDIVAGTEYIGDDANERVPQVREAAKTLAETFKSRSLEEIHALNPTVAQPPYFVSLDILDDMIRIAETVRRERLAIPFIDWFWGALGSAGIAHAGYGDDGISVPIHEPEWKQRALEQIRAGRASWVHSVKSGADAELLLANAPS